MLLELRLKYLENKRTLLLFSCLWRHHVNTTQTQLFSHFLTSFTHFPFRKSFCFQRKKEERKHRAISSGTKAHSYFSNPKLIHLQIPAPPHVPWPRCAQSKPFPLSSPPGGDCPSGWGVAEMPLLHVAAAKQEDFQREKLSPDSPATAQIWEDSTPPSLPSVPLSWPCFPMCTYNEIWTERLTQSLLFLFQCDF